GSSRAVRGRPWRMDRPDPVDFDLGSGRIEERSRPGHGRLRPSHETTALPMPSILGRGDRPATSPDAEGQTSGAQADQGDRRGLGDGREGEVVDEDVVVPEAEIEEVLES